MEAKRSDDGKAQIHLLPWAPLLSIIKVLEFGAAKYGAHNWKKGMAYSRCYNSLQRHLTAWWEGEDKDKESGLSHLSHVGCNVLFLLYYSLMGVGKDDRKEE